MTVFRQRRNFGPWREPNLETAAQNELHRVRRTRKVVHLTAVVNRTTAVLIQSNLETILYGAKNAILFSSGSHVRQWVGLPFVVLRQTHDGMFTNNHCKTQPNTKNHHLHAGKIYNEQIQALRLLRKSV
jgi:hypothetical protein